MDGNSILGLWYLYCNSMVGLWMIVDRAYDAPMQKVCDHTPRRRDSWISFMMSLTVVAVALSSTLVIVFLHLSGTYSEQFND